MVFDTNNLLLHTKRTVYSYIRLGYQYASDYPIVLGVGILLLFLHKLCPSLFSFLLSSSPVFLLTALLLGALLSYGEPCAPVIGEETLEKEKNFTPKSNISITERTTEEVGNVAIKVHTAKRFESQVVYTEERILDDTHCDKDNFISVSADTILCAESSEFSKSNAIVEREEYVKEICEKAELQEFESTNTEKGHEEVKNQYQFGELMSSCWQPVPRQDPCSDSESDITESSSDASITDIIPMLDELNPPVNSGTGPRSSTFGGNLKSSSDDDEDGSEEDGDFSSNEYGAEEKVDDGNNSNEVMALRPSDLEMNSNLESLMERRRAKNILKFELDKRLMDMQAADAIQKMEEASRFRVQVPSISTPRPNPFDPSNGSEETVELPQIPDSAPSVLLPWRKPFDIPFDQIVDCDRQLRETWTPRSFFPSTQHRKHGNLNVRQSTYLQHQNGIKLEKLEFSGKDACDSYSNSDSEHSKNNGKLFGSLEAHVGEEIKILSAAISDACVLEVNHGINEGPKNIDSSDDTTSFYIHKFISSTSETKDSVCAGGDQSATCSVSKENNSEQYIVEADYISEVNSLFKCRMEEVLVQSISESGISQPLTVKLDDELSATLSADSEMAIIEASSVQELNSQFAQINGESLAFAVSDSTSHDEWIQDRSSEALPADNGHTSELPIEYGHSSDSTHEPMAVKIEAKLNELLTEDGELPVLEASSVEEMSSLFKQLEEEVQAQMPQTSKHKFGQDEGETTTEVLVLETKSLEDISSAFRQLDNGHDEMKMSGDGEVNLDSEEPNLGLHVIEAKTVKTDDTSDTGSKVTKLKDLPESAESIAADGHPIKDM